jgi:hypothetical protein
MANDDKKFSNRMQNLFGTKYSPGKAKEIQKIIQRAKKKDGKELDSKIETLPWKGELLELFKYWMLSCHDNLESWKHREDMYNDCRMLYLNSALMAYAMTLVADEIIQANSSQQPIMVEAKRKQKKFIQELFDKSGIYHELHPTALDVVRYGNAYWLLDLEPTGVVGFDHIDVFKVKDRLEFTAHEVKQRMKQSDALFTSFKGLDRLEQLINMIKEKDNISSYYKNYLFGFQVDDKIVPPWRLLHFRNKTSESPFRPFGVPTFIHSIAPYRQYDAAMTFQALARGMSFPKEIYKLNLPNAVSPTDKIMSAIEFMNELVNSGIGTTQKEMPGLGDIIITIMDLFDYELQDSKFDLGKVDDIEMLRDDLMISTFLPRFLIDPNDGGFGESGVALAEQWKPFARLVYRHQSIMLENISQFVKIAMIHSDQFTLDDMDFILSMPYPESMTHDDLIQNQQDLLALSGDIIDDLQDRITGGEELPAELVRDIYHQFLPYDDKRIDAWVNQAVKSVQDGVGMDENYQPFKEEGLLFPKVPYDSKDPKELKEWADSVKSNIVTARSIDARKKWKLLEKTVGKKDLQESVKNIILENKQDSLREGIINQKHYYSSKNRYIDFPAETFRELDKRRLKALKEKKTTNKINERFVEKIEYEFTPEEEKPEKTDLKHGRYKFNFEK